MNKIFLFIPVLLLNAASIFAQFNTQLASFAPHAYNPNPVLYANVNGNIAEVNQLGEMTYTKVIIMDALTKDRIATTYTDATGNFSANLPRYRDYIITADKDTYFKSHHQFSTDDNEVNLTMKMERKPGYVFDVSVYDGGKVKSTVNTIANSRVEIYNNTTREEELVIENNPKANFTYAFEEGNHYTILVRKEGYLNRRIEAYVDIEGCILCFDGMGVEQPDVVPLMHHDNELGFFLGAISIDSIQVGQTFAIDNIYYDFDKANIRPDAAKELDKLVTFLRDNPGITVELGSHTDARGSDDYNMSLSDRRATSAVQYIIKNGGVSSEKITSQGYGESKLTNQCANGVTCNENLHQKNRRTELTITGVAKQDPLRTKSLKQIIEDPNLYKKVLEEEKEQKRKSLAFTSS